MTVSNKGLALIKHYEGCFLKAYPDPGHENGLPVTIGWGSTMYKDGKPIQLNDRITQEQADELLQWEVDKKAQAINGLLNGVTINQNQMDAIVSLAYNIGVGNFANSTLLKLIKKGQDASPQFLVWNKSGGKVMNGLTKRRTAEMNLYNTPIT